MGLSLGRSTHSTRGKQTGEPSPIRWEILDRYVCRNSYALKVHYPDATNFEGVKIMVFRGRDALPTHLDPHFDENDESLMCRLRPTDEGWEMAKAITQFLSYEKPGT